MLTTAFFLPLALAAASALPAVTRRDGSCPAVHIILARGNDEPYPGRQGALVTAICNKVANCDYEDVKYDIPNDPWCTTVENGVTGGLSQMKAFNQRCPDSKIVLSGYSQGAQVIGDILGGGGGKFYDNCIQKSNPGLDRTSSLGSKIVAALLWGDIRHDKDQSFNTGDGSSDDGDFPRPQDQIDGLNKWADLLRSYCDAADPICANGKNGKIHEQYFDNYDSDASDWVAKMVSGSTQSPSSSSVSLEQAQATTSAAASSSSAEAPVNTAAAELPATQPASQPSSSAASETSATLIMAVMPSGSASAVSSSPETPAATITTAIVKPAATGSVAVAGKATGSATSLNYPTTLMTLMAVVVATIFNL